MHMLRCLFVIETHHQFKVAATHIPGSDNTGQTTCREINRAQFLATTPHCEKSPSMIPISFIAVATRVKTVLNCWGDR